MLESTYVHCAGIGLKTERELWEAGAHTWNDFQQLADGLPIGPRKKEALAPLVDQSIVRLLATDYQWFARALQAREHWRTFSSFKKKVAYLDIETTGGMDPGSLTVVGLYDGIRLRQFVRGDNLDDFPEAIADAQIIVTFFGTGFDLPFLRRAFRIEFPQLHVDVCFLLKRLGYSGGLKRVEKALGINRNKETHGLDGMDAVRLWWEYVNGQEQSLETLLAYNAEDVLNMETLLHFGINEMRKRTMPSVTNENSMSIGRAHT
jgi:uncharacterized protein YprB with RNaseH-like and TPR domain